MSNIISIYGISDRYIFDRPFYIHDHNICSVNDEQLSEYYHLERITRRKYDNNIQHIVEDLLLLNRNIEINNESNFLFVNSFVGSSFISRNGRIRFDCLNRGENLLTPIKGFCWVQSTDSNGYEADGYSISHEIAHAFSVVPFAGGLRENSLMIAFDGGSSTGNFAAFHYKNGKLNQLESHWELSQLSKIFNDNGLSFGIINAAPGEHCSVPGKLMGYASLGTPDNRITEWLAENDFFTNSWGERSVFYQKARRLFFWQGQLKNNNDPFLFDIAACMQETFKMGILKKIKQLAEKTGADYLYYAGGCALNIVANSDLVSNNWFRDVFISPCCNDSGLSIGAAAYWAFINNSQMILNSPYLNNWSCNSEYSVDEADVAETVKALINGEVIGICNGSAEAGPRALGNRSILSLANSKMLAEKVSMQIKEREWYRPVAPIMLEKNARLVTGLNQIHHLSRFMLLDFTILKEYCQELQGVVHSNGTSRIQTIYDRSDNPYIFELLEHLDKNHQIKALINTSFNGKGEPMVQTPDHARDSAMKIKLDGLVINGKYQRL
jgi:carbamoyltransferase